MRRYTTLLLAFAFVVSGCTAMSKSAATGEPGLTKEAGMQKTETEEYIIGPEDILHISVWKDETLSTDAVVRSDGKISVPLANDVQASGLTVLQLKEAITTKLKEYIPGVEVTVIVTAMASNKVYVQGEVAAPGPIPFDGQLTVIQALAMAGGLTPYASRGSIVILRASGEQLRFNYNHVVRGKNLEQNVRLKRGDTIIVP